MQNNGLLPPRPSRIVPRSSGIRRHAVRILFWSLFCLPGVLQAQEAERAFVSSGGTGTVYVPPTHVVFWFHKLETAESLTESLAGSVAFGPAIREAFAQQELRPSKVESSAPAVVSLEGNAVRVSVEAQFPMAGYAGGEIGAAKLGELCDQIKAIAKSAGCELAGPRFVTAEKNAAIQSAVEEAAKNALTAAIGAEKALHAPIRAVELVEVEKITWNAPPDTEVTYPTIEQVACTAAVRVSYILE